MWLFNLKTILKTKIGSKIKVEKINALKLNNDSINNSLGSLCRNAAQKKTLKLGSKVMFATTLACLK